MIEVPAFGYARFFYAMSAYIAAVVSGRYWDDLLVLYPEKTRAIYVAFYGAFCLAILAIFFLRYRIVRILCFAAIAALTYFLGELGPFPLMAIWPTLAGLLCLPSGGEIAKPTVVERLRMGLCGVLIFLVWQTLKPVVLGQLEFADLIQSYARTVALNELTEPVANPVRRAFLSLPFVGILAFVMPMVVFLVSPWLVRKSKGRLALAGTIVATLLFVAVTHRMRLEMIVLLALPLLLFDFEEPGLAASGREGDR